MLILISNQLFASTVGISHQQEYPQTYQEIKNLVIASITKALGAKGFRQNLVKPGDKVVVKPNLIVPQTSGSGVVTDCRVTRAVVELAQDAVGRSGCVLIAEGSSRYTDLAFVIAGYDLDYDGRDDQTGAFLIDLNDPEDCLNWDHATDPEYVTQIELPDGLASDLWYLPNPIYDCDVLISVAAFKNHDTTGMTGSLKNSLGLAPTDIYHGSDPSCFTKCQLHDWGIRNSIIDLNRLRPADFSIIDALLGVTNGPSGVKTASENNSWKEDNPILLYNSLGNPETIVMNSILSSADPVALDTVACCLMGYDPNSIQYFTLAQAYELGTKETSEIFVRGKHVSGLRVDFPVPYGSLEKAQRAESEPPSLQILSPLPYQQDLKKIIEIKISAHDNKKISKVEFFIDNSFLGADADQPYTITWDTRSCKNGWHILSVEVYDDVFNEASSSIMVEVQN